MGESDARKYVAMDGVLQRILSDFIALPEDDVKRNNIILHEVIDQLISRLIDVDPLFDQLYDRLFYGGSFYENLKITEPNEYDIHVLLDIPENINIRITNSNIPGYVHVKLLNNVNQNRQGSNEQFQQLVTDTHYMDASQVRKWMEKVIRTALNMFPKHPTSMKYIFNTSVGYYYVSIKKSGPAFTLVIGTHEDIYMTVDLVPCFIFESDEWPGKPFRPLRFRRLEPNFFGIPKKPKDANRYTDHYWFLNMQKQEKQLIHEKQNLKPVVRLLKKMRDKFNQECMASYFLKTVVLWTMEDQKGNPYFWYYPLSYVFMRVLQKYRDYLRNYRIPYYWNKKFNFLGSIEEDKLDHIYEQVSKMINDIEINVDQNPFVVSKYFLSCRDQKILKETMNNNNFIFEN